MATPIPRFLASTVEVVLHMTQEGSQRANVFHYKYVATSPPTVGNLVELASNWWTAVNTAYTAMANASLNFDYVTARDIDHAGANEGVYNIVQPHPGTTAGVQAPANATSVISFRTGVAARYGRGRNYICGLSDGSATGSQVVSGYLTQLVALANIIRAFTNSGGALATTFGIASFKHNLFIPVISAIVDIYLDSQRRRLINRGR